MTKGFLHKIYKPILVFLLAISTLVFFNTIAQYQSLKSDIGFLQFKQAVIENKAWKFFFYIHVFSILFCLIAGLTQFSKEILKKHRNIHKLLGKIYVFNIVFINFPACFILSMFANGGLIGIIGFMLQNFLWLFLTVKAFLFIKKLDIINHKKYMIYSYAITTTAITFRIIKNTFYDYNLLPYDLFYGLNVWVSLSINLVAAYIIIIKTTEKLSSKH